MEWAKMPYRLIIGLCFLLTLPITAQGQQKVPIMPLKKAPGIQQGQAATPPNISGAPVVSEGPVFQYEGKLDAIRADQAVISDSTLTFAPDIIYRAENKTFISVGQFRIGDRVGYELNDKKEIKSLWLLRSNRP